MNKYNVVEKIIKAHLVSGTMTAGSEISISIDQTLTQDSTGTMAYLQFESTGVERVKTKKSVAYIDHNTLQTGFENADDHAYITGVALKHGIFVSRPGNGICHQVHLERFGIPGYTLLGSDSHTPTCGGLGMLAIGAGGLDVAVSMGGGAYHLTCPRVVNVRLHGALTGNTAAKDVILEVLRLLSVKGGVGKVIEYSGDGVATLSVPERATITNMGAELGATSSVFPSDDMTQKFLQAQGRGQDFTPLCADAGAEYDSVIDIDLSVLEPLAACPHSPDAVKKVRELAGIKVDQVCIGSCTNSSLMDMQKVSDILRGKKIAHNVSLTISPGSRQVLTHLSRSGALADIIDAGARILECACGPCIGMGQSPATDAVSVRTFNRNFYARTGTKSAGVYLVSCETAAATALTGYLTDPNTIKQAKADMPKEFEINDNLILDPKDFTEINIVRGPNIKPFPVAPRLNNSLSGTALVKLPDNITTDHIAPSDSKLLPYRSNIPFLSDYCLAPVDPRFASRAKENGGGMIIAGANYGQGSSREHAVLVPVYLKISAVIAKSFARIHRDNLINNGILPLEFMQESDYDFVEQGDLLSLSDILNTLKTGKLTVNNETKNRQFAVLCPLSERQRDMITAGGLLNTLKQG